ncbi:MAG: hypothetical protein IJ220_01485 [Clostridia bacterium]|nr:hypothetical protein [Clostridia bacterium]
MDKKKLGIIIAIILVILIIAIAVGVGIYLNKKSKDNTQSSNNTTENQVEELNSANMADQAPLIDMTNTQNVKISNGEKINISSKVAEEKEIAGLKITNIKLQTDKGISTFTAIVKNISETDFVGGTFELNFLKGDSSTLERLETFIPAIKVGKTTTINASTTADIVNASDVIISSYVTEVKKDNFS